MNDISAINRDTWAKHRTLRYFEHVEGYTDPGEQRSIEAVADTVRGKAILDLGVGAGRTVPLMLALSDDYTAIDFLPAMVDACRAKYPHLRIEWGDARDLTRFADGSFGFVMFAWNGIDAIDHEGRGLVMHEVARVLEPDGLFLFSTLNERGPDARSRPWKTTLERRDLTKPTRFVRKLGSVPLDTVNYVRYRRQWQTGDGWSLRTLNSHHFGLITHYTTLERQLDEIAEAGLDVVSIRENTHGAPVDRDSDTTRSAYLHFVVRKPGLAGSPQG